MGKRLIKNATIVNEGKRYRGSIVLENDHIEKISHNEDFIVVHDYEKIIDAEGLLLIPGIIDTHVHFRQPGLTYKADIYSESKAAVAGGVTSFMDMPNTLPQTTTKELLEEKFSIAENNSLANFSFYIGATNDNLEELLKNDPKKVCGIKVFMGSSTGNMLVDDNNILENIFKQAPFLVAVHCEDENIIKQNLSKYIELKGNLLDVSYHPLIRSNEACYQSTQKALSLAEKYNTRLHVLHISTAEEVNLLSKLSIKKEKNISAEVCIPHLWFDNNDYNVFGNFIKCNPSIKSKEDKAALWNGLVNDYIDIISTDHAPHTLAEKQNNYLQAPSGVPSIQFSLQTVLESMKIGKISLEKVVQKMCHAPADIFKISKRGYIREGYFADMVLIDLNKSFFVNCHNNYSKCGWSPFENYNFSSSITHTFVNGKLIYENGVFNENYRGKRLEFDR